MELTWGQVEELAEDADSPFKPGDQVVCVNNYHREHRFTVGHKYIIEKSYSNKVALGDDYGKRISGQYWSRFVIATNLKAEKPVKIKKLKVTKEIDI